MQVIRFVCVLALLLVSSASWAGDRVALVVGNSDYEVAGRLRNPTNDARAIARTLRDIGFDVIHRENLDGTEFRRAVSEFSAKAVSAEFAVVYFAGHGIQVGGQNYLIPVDARLATEAAAEFEAISLNSVQQMVKQAGRIGIIMVDACRDNPFDRDMRRLNPTRAVERGMAKVNLTRDPGYEDERSGLIISFATEFNALAEDGRGRHSPYTQALIDVLPTAGLPVDNMFREVRARVRAATRGRQSPVSEDSLPPGDEYLVPPKNVAPSGGGAERPAPVETDPEVAYLEAVRAGDWAAIEDFVNRYPNHPRAQQARDVLSTVSDRKFWELTEDADTLSAYSTYLAAFPEGLFADQARARIKNLGSRSKEKKSTFTLFNSVDFFGGDLTEGGIKGITQQQCQSLCASNDACLAYSFVNDERQWCWPKGAIGERRSKLGLISGIKIVVGGDVETSTAPTPQGPPQTFQILQGRDVAENDLLGQDRKGYSLRQCELYCQSDPNCTAFSYVPRLNWCWPKSGVTVLKDDPGIISGIDTSRHDLSQLSTQSVRFLRQSNMDFLGRDLTNRGYKGVSIERCERICADDGRCQAYTYVHASRSCWPKYAVSATQRVRGMTSGLKQ